jgi:hypothetical protein
MKVICIDSKGKPDKIPFEEWIKEGKVYTVISIDKMGLQDGKIGFKLEEIELTENSFPYEYYSAERFRPIEPSDIVDTIKQMFDTLNEIVEIEKDFGEEDADLNKI